MKKLLAFILVGIMMLGLCACGASGDNSGAGDAIEIDKMYLTKK